MNKKNIPSVAKLSPKQSKFVKYHLEGLPLSKSYLLAGYKSSSIENAASDACRLIKTAKVSQAIERARAVEWEKTVMSLAERKAYLSSVARTPAGQVDRDSPLCQEYSEEVDQSGNVKKKVKMPNKLEAINILSKLSGDYETRDDRDTNPFTFLVNFFTPSAGPAGSPALPSSAGSPALPPVMDAEIVPPSNT